MKTWHLLILLSFVGCAIFQPKKSVQDPLEDFYKTQPSARTRAAINLTQEARTLMESEHYNQATDTLNRALSIDPYNPFPYYFLGSLHYRQLSYRKSLGFLHKARQYSKAFPFWRAQTHFLIGLNWKALGNRKRARQHFSTAKKIDPDIDLDQLD